MKLRLQFVKATKQYYCYEVLGHGVGKIYLDREDLQAAYGSAPSALEIAVSKPDSAFPAAA
jgi:hypothetical protein